MQSFSISTDAVAPKQRYGFWREAVSSQLTGMTIDCAKSDQDHFWAKMKASRLRGATLLEIARAGDQIHRASQDIRKFPSDNLLVYMSTGATSWFRAHDADEFIADPGAIVVGYSDVPFSQAPINVPGFSCVLVSLPLNFIGSFRHDRRKALPQTIRTDEGIGALLRNHLVTLSRHAAQLPDEAIEIEFRNLAQLAALAQGSVAASHESSRDAISAGQFAHAERYLARNFHRPELSPEIVATSLGVSVRRLHALFEPSGASFSRRLRNLRLARAQGLLANSPATSVTDVAFSCGFDTLSTFYRVFKSAFGLTASEYREAARAKATH